MVDWEEFTERFLALPKIQPADDEELTHVYEGVRFLKVMPVSSLKEIKTFDVRSDDLFLISYPKAGTTWTQQIISSICDEGVTQINQTNQTHLFFKFPFLEMSWANHHSQIQQVTPNHKILQNMTSSRRIKTHLPRHFLPQQMFEKKPQIIYVARNPKDVMVSYFHMHNANVKLPSYKHKTWDRFFQDFIDGDLTHGPWFEHNLFWWEHRHDPNVLFLKYEDMIHDLKSTVIQVANYLGRHFPNNVIDKIVGKCTFESMKKNPNCNPDTLGFNQEDTCNNNEDTTKDKYGDTVVQQHSFLRKGTIGDWRNHFTVAQNDMFDNIYGDKMAGSGLIFDFGV